MTTPASPPISLHDVAVELGISSAGLSLGDARVRALAGIAAGPISLHDLLGKTAEARGGAPAIPAPASIDVFADFTTSADYEFYYVDTATAPVTATLNPDPAPNERARILDSTGHAGTNPISLDGNGHDIAGAATVPAAVQAGFGAINLVFQGSQWLVF